nr:transcription factor WhiB family protein [Rhodococcus sp. JVH1]
MRAACRGADLSVFFSPDGERRSARDRREALARQICQVCPMLVRCRDHALTVGESYGVWGGMTETDRRKHTHRSRRGERRPLGSFRDQPVGATSGIDRAASTVALDRAYTGGASTGHPPPADTHADLDRADSYRRSASARHGRASSWRPEGLSGDGSRSSFHVPSTEPNGVPQAAPDRPDSGVPSSTDGVRRNPDPQTIAMSFWASFVQGLLRAKTAHTVPVDQNSAGSFPTRGATAHDVLDAIHWQRRQYFSGRLPRPAVPPGADNGGSRGALCVGDRRRAHRATTSHGHNEVGDDGVVSSCWVGDLMITDPTGAHCLRFSARRRRAVASSHTPSGAAAGMARNRS